MVAVSQVNTNSPRLVSNAARDDERWSHDENSPLRERRHDRRYVSWARCRRKAENARRARQHYSTPTMKFVILKSLGFSA
jgi:hypothetical protein